MLPCWGMVKNLAAALLLTLTATAARAAEPYLEKTVLFERDSGGYMLYRIPGIVVTRRARSLRTPRRGRAIAATGMHRTLFCDAAPMEGGPGLRRR